MSRGGVGARGVDDACPGALRPHHAADGELLRVRVPGGAISASALAGLAAASGELGDGRVGLTSRGNLQVRGVSETGVAEFARRLRAVSLLPDAEHERVRNVVASPLSGRRAGSRDDIDALVRDLDAALCARAGLALLPGRFLFAVDDGSGDVRGEGADVVAVALGAGQYAVRPSGAQRGLRVGVDSVVAALLAVAECFLDERAGQGSRAWRVGELAGGGTGLVRRLVAAGWSAEVGIGREPGVGPEPGPGVGYEPGLVEQVDGRFAVCALAPLGLLEAEQVEALVAASELSGGLTATPTGPGEDALRVTPWRRVLVRDLELPAALAVRELLAASGLVVEPGTAWSRMTACAGRPGCAKSLTDVHADARAFVAAADPVGPAVHWAGCERGCGTPSGRDVVRILATVNGYRVDARESEGRAPTGDDARLGARDLAAAGITVRS